MAQKLTLPASRPRNALVRTLSRLGRSLGTRRHQAAAQRPRQHLKRMDLDERVREIGEW